MGVLPPDLAQRLAPIAGLRNVLVHEYINVDWDEIYRNLQQLDGLATFAGSVRAWLRQF